MKTLSTVLMNRQPLLDPVGYTYHFMSGNNWEISEKEFAEKTLLADLIYYIVCDQRLTPFEFSLTPDGVQIKDWDISRESFLKGIKNSDEPILNSGARATINLILNAYQHNFNAGTQEIMEKLFYGYGMGVPEPTRMHTINTKVGLDQESVDINFNVLINDIFRHGATFTPLLSMFNWYY